LGLSTAHLSAAATKPPVKPFRSWPQLIVDPKGMAEAQKLMPDLTYCNDADETMVGAEALVLLPEWNEFRALDLLRAGQLLVNPLVIDLRNIYQPPEMAAAGLCYMSIGRPPQAPRSDTQTELRALA
jgi:UDP-N-acetyl-D-mannosaminuronate dehydrogenase